MDYKDYINQLTVSDEVKRENYHKLKQCEKDVPGDGCASVEPAPKAEGTMRAVAKPGKRLAVAAAAFACAAAIAVTATVLPLSLGNMSGGNANLLSAAAKAEEFTYNEFKEQSYKDIQAGANAFAYDFSALAYSDFGKSDNLAVSPVSVYMALSIAAECAAGQTREEIVNALGVPYDTLKRDFEKLYRSLIAERTTQNGGLISKLSLTNSLWLNSGIESFSAKDLCVKSLSENYYCHSYSADFTNDNENANLALKQFVKKQTNNLINRDFNISNSASFILMNTLYLKDLWNYEGRDLTFTPGKYDFKATDGAVKSLKLLRSYYTLGRSYESRTFTHYYALTSTGYKIKFILPKEGYSVADVFTAENIEEVNTIDTYNAYDHENLLRYHTRCLFPEFKASFDKNVRSILEEKFGVSLMFDAARSDFGSISDLPHYCSEVRHVTSLKVDRKGIEGAAVTVEPMSGAPGPDEYTDVYEDFVIDGAFGYMITDRYDTVIFAGVINSV